MKITKPWLIKIIFVLLLVAVIGVSLSLNQKPPDKPTKLLWDKETCFYCKMHISDKRYAAQIQTKAFKTLFFGDLGCLFLYRRDHNPEVHAVYYRDEENWILEKDAVFIKQAESPMGFNLAAMSKSNLTTNQKAMSLRKAKEYVFGQ